MINSKIDHETAEADFNRMLLAMDVDLDGVELDEEEARDYNIKKSTITRAIQAGSLTVSEAGIPTYTTKRGAPLTINEIDGNALLALDGIKKTDESRRLFKLIQTITGSNIKATELVMKDIRILSAMVGLFLAL